MLKNNKYVSYSRKKYLQQIFKKGKWPILLILSIIYIINQFFITSIKIKNDSMYPTIQIEENYLIHKYPLIYNKLNSLFKQPIKKYKVKPFDIVAINKKEKSIFTQIINPFVTILSLGFINLNKNEYFLARIIGVPGQYVSIQSQKIYINGKKIKPHWNIFYKDTSIIPPSFTNRDYLEQLHLKKDHFFILNDNWGDTSDSRTLLTIPYKNIVGIIHH